MGKNKETDILKSEIKSMLNNIVGEDLAKNIFEANFPEPIRNYKPGKILTFKQLKALPEGTIIHIYYLDEDGNLREDGFQKLHKGKSTVNKKLDNIGKYFINLPKIYVFLKF